MLQGTAPACQGSLWVHGILRTKAVTRWESGGRLTIDAERRGDIEVEVEVEAGVRLRCVALRCVGVTVSTWLGPRPCAYASPTERLGKYVLSAEWEIEKGHGDSFEA